MHRLRRSRSVSSVITWLVALGVMTAAAAWQFHWFPTDKADPVAPEPRPGFEPLVATDDASTPPAPEPFTIPDEQTLFALQKEPSVNTTPPVPESFSATGQEPNPAERTAPRLLENPEEFNPIPPSEIVRTANSEVPTGWESAEATLVEIDRLIAQGQPQDDIAAHKKLSKLYWDHPEWRDALQSRIDTTTSSIYFSPQPHYMAPYIVADGDQLAKVAAVYRVPWEFLAALNRTDPKRIRPGQKLKVIKGPFGAVVDLSRYELTIEHHGFVVKRYTVGIGKDNSTPLGEFTVKNKLDNPTYYGPDGQVVDRDDPQNPLGEHWIDLGDSYGIHGTNEPDSIGQAASRGCIRMHNPQVAEVFRFLSVGSKVVIRR